MRWIDRGPEPDGVAGYAQRYTQGWVDHFQNGLSERPADFLWSVFRTTLGSQSNNICWYCERQCDADAEVGGLAPTVDHFRPLSRFPQLAYAWTNWIFSCQRCNVEYKGDKWPESGYVDPCADDVTERPERYFDYDETTGEIVPKDGISVTDKSRALDTIRDLGLNELDVMFYRLNWTRAFTADLSELPVSERGPLVEYITRQSVEYAGVTRMLVEQFRMDGRL